VSSSEEGAGYDEKQASDGSESEASHPPEIVSQHGHAMAAEQQKQSLSR